MPSVNQLREKLFTANDGIAACAAINTLGKHAKKGSLGAKQVLADYMQNGSINHMRDYACSVLAGALTAADTAFAIAFRDGLADKHLQYWCVQGYLNAAGKKAYRELVLLVKNTRVRLAVRCQALKSLASHSKQPFDRDLPSDPGYWKSKDLRLDELSAWARQGYPDGMGYVPPARDPHLIRPRTAFEKLVARLDAKLARKRSEQQDPAMPSNWLAVASKEDIRQIRSRWKLPVVYVDFLTRFSPIRVMIDKKRFYNPFQLFGASELIAAQDGYAYLGRESRRLKDWPPHLIVIASHGGDPFVLDLSRSDGREAPVAWAEHGAGDWDFTDEARSFTEFLKKLAT